MASIWQGFYFIVLGKGAWPFHFRGWWSAFLKSWKCVMLWRDSAKLNPMDDCQSFHFILLEKGVWTFHFISGIPPFRNLENVLPPQRTLRYKTQWDPLVRLFILLCLRNGFYAFKFPILHRPFWNLYNFSTEGGPIVSTYILSLEEICREYQIGVQFFLFRHYLGFERYIDIPFERR